MTMSEYTIEQYAENYPPGIERYFWNIARNAIIARSLKRSHMDTWPLLDIGCGRGIVVEYLRSRGINCIGCDTSAAPVPDHLRAVVLAGTDIADIPAEQRDTIRGALICDVIEHLADPVAFLLRIASLLPALERVLLTVPGRQELWSEWDRHYGHFRRYNLIQLKATLTSAGFTPLWTQYFFHALYLPAFLLRGEKLRSTEVKAPSWLWPQAAFAAMFRAEEVLLPSALPGTSALMIAERNVPASDNT